jgi:uncharacterized membrane protein YdjX (TVP38/TMEM64 family)
LARIPSILISTWCGNELVGENHKLSLIVLLGTLAIGILGGVLYKIIVNKHKPKKEAEADPSTEEKGEIKGEDRR